MRFALGSSLNLKLYLYRTPYTGIGVQAHERLSANAFQALDSGVGIDILALNPGNQRDS